MFFLTIFFFQRIYKNPVMYIFHCFSDHYTPLHIWINSEWPFLGKVIGEKLKWQKWPFWIFSDNFSQKDSEWPKMAVLNFFYNFSPKDWYKFGMAKNGPSKFFPTIFPKKTGTNLEWPKMAIPNFSNDFSQKDWYKFGMTKNGCSNFFLKRLVQIWNGKRWPFQIFSDIFS